MNVRYRLSEFLKFKKISQKELSILFGKTPSAVSGIMSGKSDITTSQLIIIANEFLDINLRWLLTGEGEMLEKGKIKEGKNEVNEPNGTYTKDSGKELELTRKLLERTEQLLIEMSKSRAPISAEK